MLSNSHFRKVCSRFVRTLQGNYPFLGESKFYALRILRNSLKIPFEMEFNAIRLFPDIEGALYLDIGAHRGQSIDAIMMRNHSCSIQSFEPNPLRYEKLVKRFAQNNRVKLHNFGLGSETGEFTLYVPCYKRYVFDSLGSFEREHAINSLRNSKSLYFYQDRYLSIYEIKCVVKRLDDLELAPFFMKLDIQGYELPALLGAEQTLRNSRPILLIESVTKAGKIMKYLSQFGYTLYRYEHQHLIPGEAGDLNSFVITGDKYEMLKRSSRS